MLLKEALLKRIGRTAEKQAGQERFTSGTVFEREISYRLSMTESQIADHVSELKSRAAKKRTSGLKAELKFKTKLEALHDKEPALRETLLKQEQRTFVRVGRPS